MTLFKTKTWTAKLSAALVSGTMLSAVLSSKSALALGDLVDTTSEDSLKPLYTGISAVSYGAGGLFAVMGAKGVYNHVQNPQGDKLGPEVGKLVLGAALFAAPAVMNAVGETSGGAGGAVEAYKAESGF